MSFLRFYLRTIKKDFWPKNQEFLSSCFSAHSHSVIIWKKVNIFSKRVSKASHLICFLLLMLLISNYTFDALLHGKASKVLKFKEKRIYFKKHIELTILIDKTILIIHGLFLNKFTISGYVPAKQNWIFKIVWWHIF